MSFAKILACISAVVACCFITMAPSKVSDANCPLGRNKHARERLVPDLGVLPYPTLFEDRQFACFVTFPLYLDAQPSIVRVVCFVPSMHAPPFHSSLLVCLPSVWCHARSGLWSTPGNPCHKGTITLTYGHPPAPGLAWTTPTSQRYQVRFFFAVWFRLTLYFRVGTAC